MKDKLINDVIKEVVRVVLVGVHHERLAEVLRLHTAEKGLRSKSIDALMNLVVDLRGVR